MTDADQPPDADPRPWQEQGAVRRDVAPHRSNLLMLLANVALVLGLSSFCLVVTGWAALPLGLLVEWLAQRDLEGMQAGTMDPRGRRDAELAWDLAGYVCSLGFVGGLLCGLPLLYCGYSIFSCSLLVMRTSTSPSPAPSRVHHTVRKREQATPQEVATSLRRRNERSVTKEAS
jgi:hypothetical protein